MALADSIINVESGGQADAKNPNSSASGPGQFIDSTWLNTLRAHRPDLAQGQSDSDLLALKSDPALSRDMTAAYASDNGAILSKAGLPVTPGTQYLAHFAGPGGAVGLLNASPDTPAGAVLGPGVVRANPFLAHMTAGDVAAWADRKMGGTASAQAPVAAPLAMGGPPAPQSAQPAAPPQQAAAPSAPIQGDAAPPPFSFFPPRPKIDLASIYANMKRG